MAIVAWTDAQTWLGARTLVFIACVAAHKLMRALSLSHVQVDCTAEVDMCRQHFITGFPSIRVFRRAHDDIYIQGHHEHEVSRAWAPQHRLVSLAARLPCSCTASTIWCNNFTTSESWLPCQ